MKKKPAPNIKKATEAIIKDKKLKVKRQYRRKTRKQRRVSAVLRRA